MSLYIGLISGTSVDGIDAVLVDFESPPLRVLAALCYPIPDDLRAAVLGADEANSLRETLVLDVELGRLFGQAALSLLHSAGVDAADVAAVGSHGQTVLHRPNETVPYTLQIGDPNVIAELTGITTVADFRRRDMAVQGQGAPLAPAFHRAVLGNAGVDRAVLNIGGIANVTILPASAQAEVLGFDTGPGNGLLDAWAQAHTGAPIDEDGRWGASGELDPELLHHLLDDQYFVRPAPKSTGKDYFNLTWLRSKLGRMSGSLEPADVQRTLAELTASSICRAIATNAPHTSQVLVCGGGVRNPLLLDRLTDILEEVEVTSTAHLGLDPDWVESVAFAWLAKQTLEGRPGNLPSVTGANREVVLGAIYAGR